MKRIAKNLFKALGAVILALLALFLVFVARPEWFLTPPRLRWAAARFGRAYHPAWKTFEPAIRSPGFLDKEMTVQAEDFCFRDDARGASGCLPWVDIALRLRLGWRPYVKLRRIERLTVRADDLSLDASRPAPANRAKGKRRRFTLRGLVPKAARGMVVDSIDLSVKSLRVKQADGSLSASAWAVYPSSGPRLAAAARLLSRKRRTGASLWNARLDLRSDLFQQGRLTYLNGDGALAGPGGTVASFEARVSQPGRERLRLHAGVRARRAAQSLRFTLAGEGTPARWDLQGSLAVAQASGPVRSAGLNDCAARLELDARQGVLRKASLACGLRVQPAPFGVVGASVPAAAVGRVDASADLNGRRFSARLTAGLSPETGWQALSARLESAFAGDLRRLPDSLKGKASAALRIARFEDLVAYLRNTNFSVPAPLNVLKGPVDATLKAQGDMPKLRQGASYLVTTDLAGGGQRLKVSAMGTLAGRRSASGRPVVDVTAMTNLQEVAFDLPYLRIGPMPKVVVDSRIRTGPPPPSAPAPQAADPPPPSAGTANGPPPAPAQSSATVEFGYDARVFTSKPALLRSNLAQSPIPVSLDMSARPDALSGTISVGRFDAKLFRQLATVDHVTLTARPGSSEAGLDGLVVYRRPDATIYIHLLGSTAKPQVSLSSDPPMTRDQITALLLYGQTPDALDEDQRANVGNASNGMANGAFGLASLYLFASTPIEYVGYDPTTQTYAVRLKIPGGVHMELGSSSLQESRYLTLRKRLAPHWQVETQAATSQEQGSAITTFLEWFERY